MNKDIYRNIAAVTAIFIISLSVMLIIELFSSEGRYAASDRGGGDLEATERYESG